MKAGFKLSINSIVPINFHRPWVFLFIYTRGQQTFSVKGRRVNNLEFAGRTVTTAAT